MGEKVWEVTFGHNWSKIVVIAKDMESAVIKARGIDKLPKSENWVSKVELIAETDG
jgi:hypothetical protein